MVNRWRIGWKGNPEVNLEFLPGCRVTPLEILYAAGHEGVVHLDDLLLRRVRLGLLQHDGGVEHFVRFKRILDAGTPMV